MEKSEERVGTPDSMAGSSISVFQNYSAADVFIQGLAGIVNQGDVEHMIRGQKQMLQRFEKTNEMLLNCNALSESRIKTTEEDFKKHIKMIGDMKKDLDVIFRKIRSIKAKISAQYPDAVSQVEVPTEDDNEDEDEETGESGGRGNNKKSDPEEIPAKEPQVEYEQMVHSPGTSTQQG